MFSPLFTKHGPFEVTQFLKADKNDLANQKLCYFDMFVNLKEENKTAVYTGLMSSMLPLYPIPQLKEYRVIRTYFLNNAMLSHVSSIYVNKVVLASRTDRVNVWKNIGSTRMFLMLYRKVCPSLGRK